MTPETCFGLLLNSFVIYSITSYGERQNEFDTVVGYFRAHFTQVHKRNNENMRVLYTHLTNVVVRPLSPSHSLLDIHTASAGQNCDSADHHRHPRLHIPGVPQGRGSRVNARICTRLDVIRNDPIRPCFRPFAPPLAVSDTLLAYTPPLIISWKLSLSCSFLFSPCISLCILCCLYHHLSPGGVRALLSHLVLGPALCILSGSSGNKLVSE